MLGAVDVDSYACFFSRLAGFYHLGCILPVRVKSFFASFRAIVAKKSVFEAFYCRPLHLLESQIIDEQMLPAFGANDLIRMLKAHMFAVGCKLFSPVCV